MELRLEILTKNGITKTLNLNSTNDKVDIYFSLNQINPNTMSILSEPFIPSTSQ